MPTTASGFFELPDTMTALPRRPFEFSASAADEADRLLALEPEALFRRLLRDQESEAVLLASRRILHTFLGSAAGPGQGPDDAEVEDAEVDDAQVEDTDADGAADSIAAHVASARTALHAQLDALSAATSADPEARAAVLRQRAPIMLLAGCWLDVLSQPATQPSVIVNRLFAQYYALRGSGDPLRSCRHLRRRALEDAAIRLPEFGAAGFLAATGARPLTALHASCYIAGSRLPANFLPELLGLHYTYFALGIDDHLLRLASPLPETDLRVVLAEYLRLAGPDERGRLREGVRLGLALEREHVALLADLAAWHRGRSLESKVAEIVARHAPLAGSQHGFVRVGGRSLTETFADPDLDLAGFLRDLRESPRLRPGTDGGESRFIRAIKFGGPMFGIFDEHEADLLKQWVATVQAGERPAIELARNTVGDEYAARWRAALAASRPDDVVIRGVADPRDERELFHRLVNIENYANTLPLAAEYAQRLLAEAEIMFVHGAEGRYTDATYFDYSPEALYARAEQIYFEKLVKPYRPLEVIPEREDVVFRQTTYALGALVDGAWLHRLGNLGHAGRPSDHLLAEIYADEMGHGDLAKNHLTLIHTALASMAVELPHIRDAAFMDQGELPDELYGFSLYQLCLALFPDSHYNEILGYNLAIEMFGLGELRLHEIQKLNHHGFDACYETAHLTIDNISAGHTKQAADIIVGYLDDVQRAGGDDAVQREWRRIWRGYAAYAYIVEDTLRKKLASEADADADVDVLLI
jgi:Iron-containing redox enzyme